MMVTTVAGTGRNVTDLGITVPTDTEKFTLLSGLTLTLVKAWVSWVFWLVWRLAETRVAGCDCAVLACVLVEGVAAFWFCAGCWAVDGCDLLVSEAVAGCDLLVPDAVEGWDLLASDAVEG